MSYYGVIFPEFWTGRTGRELREHGGKDAQVLALYLATNRHANMIGLYPLTVEDIKYETGLGAKAVERGFAATEATGFAVYDAETSFVWVYQMARFRLGLKAGEALHQDDRRVIAVNKLYHGIESNPFLGEFYDRNHTILRLKKGREPQGIAASYTISGPLQGALKPLPSQDQDQDQIKARSGSEIRKQDQEKARTLPRPQISTDQKRGQNENAGAVRELVLDLVGRADRRDTFADLKDLAKTECARAHLAYDAELVGNVLEQALARQRKAVAQ